MIAVVCGGVGAARFLGGLLDVVAPSDVTAIVNTGDDTVMHGLTICPDLDTITYTLSGSVNPETGWGLASETWKAMDALERLGGETWFRLGDSDLGTHLYRTARLRAGATLSEVTAEIASAFGLELSILPMSDDPVRTRMTLAGGREVAFQEYFVGMRHSVAVTGVRFEGADVARPARGVIDILEAASTLVIAPSNPVVSIGPVLAVPGVKEVLVRRRSDVVAISPIVGGAALKGPADRLLVELGGEASVGGVARHLAGVAGTLVIDDVDAPFANDVEEAGVRAVVTGAVMSTREKAASLASAVLAAAGE